MALKSNGKYACSYCGKEFNCYQEADACRDNHDLIYLALTKEDISRVLQFFYTKDEELLSEELIKRFQFVKKFRN